MASIASNIKKLMGDSGYTSMRKLSLDCGYSESLVKSIVYGKIKSPTYEVLKSLACVLKCNIADITGDNDNSPTLVKQNNNISFTPKRNEKLFDECYEITKLALDDLKDNKGKKIKLNKFDVDIIAEHLYKLVPLLRQENSKAKISPNLPIAIVESIMGKEIL